MLIILFLLHFVAIFEACIPTQQVVTSTICPVCGTIYQRNCVNSFGLACQSASAINAIPTLSGTTCSLTASCPTTNAFYYLTDGSEEYSHGDVKAHCDESDGIWYFESVGYTPVIPISNFICLV
ncbi:unnamed protein product [Caenorhabditis angaria]|uniref:Fibrinogen C-terminal domain-containing protein n=1 Tax=Caenorhabditis angaria TaxID=860376 RepID=A0A9P1IK25_9PELO|nr:unnamed protein product [Caenorhabditis angaria]